MTGINKIKENDEEGREREHLAAQAMRHAAEQEAAAAMPMMPSSAPPSEPKAGAVPEVEWQQARLTGQGALPPTDTTGAGGEQNGEMPLPSLPPVPQTGAPQYAPQTGEPIVPASYSTYVPPFQQPMTYAAPLPGFANNRDSDNVALTGSPYDYWGFGAVDDSMMRSYTIFAISAEGDDFGRTFLGMGFSAKKYKVEVDVSLDIGYTFSSGEAALRAEITIPSTSYDLQGTDLEVNFARWQITEYFSTTAPSFSVYAEIPVSIYLEVINPVVNLFPLTTNLLSANPFQGDNLIITDNYFRFNYDNTFTLFRTELENGVGRIESDLFRINRPLFSVINFNNENFGDQNLFTPWSSGRLVGNRFAEVSIDLDNIIQRLAGLPRDFLEYSARGVDAKLLDITGTFSASIYQDFTITPDTLSLTLSNGVGRAITKTHNLKGSARDTSIDISSFIANPAAAINVNYTITYEIAFAAGIQFDVGFELALLEISSRAFTYDDLSPEAYSLEIGSLQLYSHTGALSISGSGQDILLSDFGVVVPPRPTPPPPRDPEPITLYLRKNTPPASNDRIDSSIDIVANEITAGIISRPENRVEYGEIKNEARITLHREDPANENEIEADAFLYWSRDKSLSANDIRVGKGIVISFHEGDDEETKRNDFLTHELTGAGYLILDVDPDNEVAETNENNNIVVSDLITIKKINLTAYRITPAEGMFSPRKHLIHSDVDVEVNFRNTDASRLLSEVEVRVDLYWSTDDEFSSDDIWRSTDYFNGGVRTNRFGELLFSNVNLNVSGKGYILAILDIHNDITESNERDNVIASEQIEVLGHPDLALRNLVITTENPTAGEVVNFEYDIVNLGGGSVYTDFNVYYFWSKDATLSNDDVLLSYTSNGISKDNFSETNSRYHVSDSTGFGGYSERRAGAGDGYIIAAITDDIDTSGYSEYAVQRLNDESRPIIDVNEDNNFVASERITLAGADLVGRIDAVEVDENHYSLTVTYTVQNTGDAAITQNTRYSIYLYWSSDPLFSRDEDTFLYVKPRPEGSSLDAGIDFTLAPGEMKTFTNTHESYSPTTNTYNSISSAVDDFNSGYIFAVFDWFLTIPESNENNLSAPFALAPPPPAPSYRGLLTGTKDNEIFTFDDDIEYRVDGVAGDDHYIITSNQSQNVELADRLGTNHIYFDDGVHIARSDNLTGDELIYLANGKTVRVNGASNYRFYLGNQNGNHNPLTIAEFRIAIEMPLLVAGMIDAARINTDSSSSARALLLGGAEDNEFGLGSSLAGEISGGAGDDHYRLTRFQRGDVHIRDSLGDNIFTIDIGVKISYVQALTGSLLIALENRAEIIIDNAFTNFMFSLEGATPIGANAFRAHYAEADIATYAATYNLITGSTAADTALNGTASADHIAGLDKNDIINGGAGDDILDGGADDDTLTGGVGADVFIYRFHSSQIDIGTNYWRGLDGYDVITDFNPTQGDKLRLLDKNAANHNRIDSVAELRAAIEGDNDDWGLSLAASADDSAGGAILLSFGSPKPPVAADDISGTGGILIERGDMPSSGDNFEEYATNADMGIITFDEFLTAIGGEAQLEFA